MNLQEQQLVDELFDRLAQWKLIRVIPTPNARSPTA